MAASTTGDFTQGVVVFLSEVSGSVQVKKHMERAKFLLQANKIEHRVVDVSLNEADKDWMVAQSGKRTLPQIFVNGAYKGGFDELEMANEDGKIKEFCS